MVVQEEQDRVKNLLAQALPMLCKNGLEFSNEFCIEALIGITLDKNDVFLVSIKETITNSGKNNDEQKDIDVSIVPVSPNGVEGSRSKSHRKRRRSRNSKPKYSDSESDQATEPEDIKREKREDFEYDPDDSSDKFDPETTPHDNTLTTTHETAPETIVVKEEPSDDLSFDSNFGGRISQVSGAVCYDAGTTSYVYPQQQVLNQSLDSALPNVSKQNTNGTTPEKNVPVKRGSSRTPSTPEFVEKKHMYYATDQWRCKHCDHTSKWKGGLKRHVEARHMQISKYKCRFCGKGFRWSSTSIYHANKCKKNTFNIVVTRNYFDGDDEEDGESASKNKKK